MRAFLLANLIGVSVWAGLFGIGFAAESIPHDASLYRSDLVRNARLVWGLDAPVATFAGQIHQESRWRPSAHSKFASGLAQFTPDTVNWIAGAYPATLGERAPTHPAWAVRALATYDKYLFDRITARDGCQRMAMALSAYNGGLGWLIRDRKLALAEGADPLVWFGSVERYNAGRAPAFFNENRGYPAAILDRWEPLYFDGGWGDGACHR